MHTSKLPMPIQNAILGFWEQYRKDPVLMSGLQSLIDMHPVIGDGLHFWRPVSQNGSEFTLPDLLVSDVLPILAWSRLLKGREILCAINLDLHRQWEVYVTIDKELYPPDAKLNRLWGPASIPAQLNIEDRNGKAVRLTIPSRTLVIYG